MKPECLRRPGGRDDRLVRSGKRAAPRAACRSLTLRSPEPIIHLVMARKQPYEVIFAPQVKAHLQAIERKYRSLIRDKINEQLPWEPGVRTTNRKSLRTPVLGADWELRFGPDNRFRVLYDIDDENHQVVILAVGTKEGERLLVSGEEVQS